MKAKDLDKKFDAGENVLGHFDMSSAAKAAQSMRRVNVDFPEWMVLGLDREATRLGVTRQSIIKVWISERLKAA
jgi:hypothetical protein